MPSEDITFCSNSEECPQRIDCRRAKEPKKTYSSWSAFYDSDNEVCEYYLPTTEAK